MHVYDSIIASGDISEASVVADLRGNLSRDKQTIQIKQYDVIALFTLFLKRLEQIDMQIFSTFLCDLFLLTLPLHHCLFGSVIPAFNKALYNHKAFQALFLLL